MAPSMDAGMKEDIKRRHGYTKTKELFPFDDGLTERHGFAGVLNGVSVPFQLL